MRLVRRLLAWGPPLSAITWSADGKRLVGSGGAVPVWCLDESLAAPDRNDP